MSYRHDRFFIGTKNKIVDLPMPIQGAPETYSRFGANGDYINGGKWQYASSYNAKSQDLSFNRAQGITDLDALLHGRFGLGYIYYHDPFAVNLLPGYLAQPSKGTIYQPTWDKFASVQEVTTPDNTFNLPVKGATLGVNQNGYRIKFTFVIPDGADLAVSIKGVPNPNIDFKLTWGSDFILPVCDLTTLWDTVIPNQGERLATLEMVGDGVVELYGLMLHVTNAGANTSSVTRRCPEYIDGTGQSGCEISENEISRGLFALGQPWERESFALSLMETELFNV